LDQIKAEVVPIHVDIPLAMIGIIYTSKVSFELSKPIITDKLRIIRLFHPLYNFPHILEEMELKYQR
jgi:hypothetical protein